MTISTAPAALGGMQAAERIRWFVLALVFAAGLLNYMDRQALALLKPTLEDEFGWSATDYAHINSGFQIATICSLMAAGWFVDKVGVRTGYAIGVGGWSLAQTAHVLVSTVGGFFTMRIVLASFEAIGLPAALKTVATWFRGDDRSLALGVMNVAPNIGAVATPLLVPAIAIAFGWKAAFIITGAIGLVWLVFWLMLPRAAELQAPPAAEVAAADRGLAPLGRLLRDRRTWTIAFAKFLSDFVWVFLLFWGPALFADQYDLDTGGVALPTALVFLMAGAGSLLAGATGSYMLARGRSFNLARKLPMTIAAILALPVFVVAEAPNVWIAASLLGLTLAAHQIFSTSVFGLATDIFPARSVGLVIGFAATVGNLSGLAMNEFTGWAVDNLGTYAPMLAMCAGAKVIAVLVVHLMVPNVDRTRAAMLAAEAGRPG